jgi:hypothetical protein
LPGDADLNNVQDVDFAALKTEFEKMKKTAENLKGVKDAKELPESLEDVDLDELKTEFEGMTELVTKIKGFGYNQLPNEMKDLDLTELETEFTGVTETVQKLNDIPVRDKFKDMDFNETKAAYDSLKGFSNRLKMMPAGTRLADVADVDFEGIVQNFNFMKDTSDRLKTVKTNHDIPESLEDVNFNEMKEEFTVMAELSKKLREMQPTDLPAAFMTVNFQDVEADFEAMKTTADNLAKVPKRDKIKEMNFDDVKTGYDTIKGAKSSIENLDAGANLMNANVDFAGLKTEFERMYDVADKLKEAKDGVELPETLENVDFDELKTEFLV